MYLIYMFIRYKSYLLGKVKYCVDILPGRGPTGVDMAPVPAC